MSSRWVRLGALMALLALGFYLRTVGFTSGLWLDELISLHYARGDSVLEIHERSRAGLNIHDGTYFALLHLVCSAVGESEVTLRLPSLITGMLLPLCAYLGLRRPWGRAAAATAMVLLLLHPRLVYNSHNARPYALGELALMLVALGLASALRSGRLRGRVLAWGAALAMAYTHKLFLCLLPALALAPLLTRGRHAYSRRKLLIDGSVATLLLLPLLDRLGATMNASQNTATYWVPELTFRDLERALVPGCYWVLLVGAVLFAAGWLNGVSWRRFIARRRGEEGAASRGLTIYFLLLIAVHGTLLVTLTARGGNLFNERYTTPIIVSLCCLFARVVSAWPRPAAAVVLFALTLGALNLKTPLPHWVQYWREAGERLDELEPGRDPVVLWTGQAEAELLRLEPEAVTPHLLTLLDCPLRLRVGGPDRELRVVLVPTSWGKPGHGEYFERVVVPALEDADRFFLVAPPGYPRHFDEWLSRRFPESRRSHAAGDFPPVSLLTYERDD